MRYRLASLVAGVVAGIAVAVTMTFLDWRLNPGEVFHDETGTHWGAVWETAISWFLPVALIATAFAWLVLMNRGNDGGGKSGSDEFPALLQSLHKLPFDYLEGDGIDFEPYRQFLSPDDTTDWLRSWTGNDTVSADGFRVFGQDGTGGLAAFWLTRDGRPILEQPIVFFGSEGELGVVARNFGDYLWLLAHGIGPYEAVAEGAGWARDNAVFREFAEAHAPGNERDPRELLDIARRDFPDFEGSIRALCN